MCGMLFLYDILVNPSSTTPTPCARAATCTLGRFERTATGTLLECNVCCKQCDSGCGLACGTCKSRDERMRATLLYTKHLILCSL